MVFFITVALAVWVGSMVIWYLVSNVFKSKDVDKIKSRLAGKEPKATVKTKERRPALIETEDLQTGKFAIKLLKKFDLQPRLQALLEQAGLKWRVARLVHACLGCFLLGYLCVHFFLPPKYRILGLIPAALCGMLPILHVSRKRASRLHRFEELFPDSLEFVSRSMRAGHAFSVSLEMIHREFQEPLSSEFKRAFEEHNLGLPLDVALEKLAKRVPLLDVQFFVSAVILQKRTGGNLAEILDKLAFIIRERFKLRGKIRAISAHGRMTGMALSSIPMVVAVLMFFSNREYILFFFNEEIGMYLAGAGLTLQLLGYWVIQQIVKIEV
ncbi:type II secretion system F family protein [Bryobacter aggregatus]|uniref:type II secretion system F family protein n=1 Tax=Bryobacter aggregatus TaxID=360054 RepID=UPI00068B9CC9|nr:type II secretion system F family protein [Bryobacter aggregatus]